MYDKHLFLHRFFCIDLNISAITIMCNKLYQIHNYFQYYYDVLRKEEIVSFDFHRRRVNFISEYFLWKVMKIWSIEKKKRSWMRQRQNDFYETEDKKL